MIVGIAVVKNESDIIESFVRRNLRLLDRLIVLDSESADPTRQILGRLEREGLAVAVRRDDDPAHRQGEKMTRLMHEAVAALRPDWIITLDADEILVGVDRTGLREALAALPAAATGSIPWVTYVATERDDPREPDPARRLRHRRARDNPLNRKLAVPDVLARDPDLHLVDGNHALRSETGRTIETIELPGVRLAHFPLRSPAQATSKLLVGWLSTRLHAGRERGVGWHWQEMFETVRSKGGLDWDDLRHWGERYADVTAAELVEDPMPGADDVSLAHADAIAVDPLRNLLAFAESLAIRPADGGDALRRERSELRREVTRLRHAIDEIRGSTSWRVTAPLRSLARMVRGG